MRPARLRGGMGEQRYVTHKVEAKNPALRKKRAPDRAGGQLEPRDRDVSAALELAERFERDGRI